MNSICFNNETPQCSNTARVSTSLFLNLFFSIQNSKYVVDDAVKRNSLEYLVDDAVLKGLVQNFYF
jgi:hypothetical protein